MPFKTLLITPPFTQLNTPYPAIMYLKGYLDSKGLDSSQCDLSIELFSAIFTKQFITEVFLQAGLNQRIEFTDVWEQREDYINKVNQVVHYLQNHTATAAYQIIHDGFLPKSHRASKMEENMDWAFGNLGILDKAKHVATLFIEELGDFIQANVDEFFAFTNYAEQIASSASSFDKIEEFLNFETTIIEDKLLELFKEKIEQCQPDLICFTIPFPGNLFSALRCAQYVKANHPNIKIAFGGGYCNTELRSLSDPKIFKYVDFISLDSGESTLLKIIQHLSENIALEELERTFILKDGKVYYQNKLPNTPIKHDDLPSPSYNGLTENSYLSFLDVMNPMHRLWSDGRWNKLTISYGCYWKQCSFCDIHLDYIGNYQNTTADKLVDKIEDIINETGVTGFHFVDEAAPPKMLRALATKLIERKVFITWWTNIRFEKTFTYELCQLLAKSGCIAVTGGLEVASDRLLALMKKGVTIQQVANVTNAFAENNILVHAYLMFGFPTETAQETIDSLEIVRQLFLNGCIHSAYWHKFTATAHSPVGKNPSDFNVEIIGPKFKGFAQNDLLHNDSTGANHQEFSAGLNEALANYLSGVGLDEPLENWFEFKVDSSLHAKNLIESFLA